MRKLESDARYMVERLNELPEDVRDMVCYIIQGAALVAGNYALNAEQPVNPKVKL